MVLALEFWTPPFHLLTNASANLLVFVAKFGVTPQLGLQRHLASKGAKKAVQGGPKVIIGGWQNEFLKIFYVCAICSALLFGFICFVFSSNWDSHGHRR